MTAADNRRLARALQDRAQCACRDARALVGAVRHRRASSAAGQPCEPRPAMGRVRRAPVHASARAVAASESRRVEGEAAPRRWARAPVVAERLVMDGSRRPWTVRELDTHDLPGAAAPRCLIFENSEVVRRAWRYPADWLALSDRDLLAIVQAAR